MLKDKSYEYEKKSLRFTHWCKESKGNRTMWTRRYRAHVRDALNAGNEVPVYKPSGGWLTW